MLGLDGLWMAETGANWLRRNKVSTKDIIPTVDACFMFGKLVN